jgi:hypothetical protein
LISQPHSGATGTITTECRPTKDKVTGIIAQ